MSSDDLDYDYEENPRYDDLIPGDQAPLSPYRAYLEESAMPLTGLLFTLPLFAAYHLGLWWMKAFEGQSWANAADLAIAWALSKLDWAGPLLSFVVVVATFFGIQFLRRDALPWRRPTAGTFVMMTAESLVFALPVILLNRVVHFLRRDLADALTTNAPALSAAYAAEPAAEAATADGGGGISLLAQVALSCGAGVYEEFLFRLVLMGGLALLVRLLFGLRKGALAFTICALGQALLFSAFHHLPGSEDAFEMGKFAFRTAAGVYFAYLYWERGFGIAAGAHAGYDLFTVAAAAQAGG